MLAADDDLSAALHPPEDGAGYVLADAKQRLELAGADSAVGVNVLEHRRLDLLGLSRHVRHWLAAAGDCGNSPPAAVAVEGRRRWRVLTPNLDTELERPLGPPAGGAARA